MSTYFGRFLDLDYGRAFPSTSHFTSRCSFANIAELEDAAATGAARLAAFDVRPEPVAPKPVVARVAGADIRRFIPRRAV